MILPAEALPATVTGMGSDASVYQLVSSEFFITCKCFVATRLIAPERPLAGMNPQVVLELAVV